MSGIQMRAWWKADHARSEVRQVEGETWPGKDSEGDVVYETTHYFTRERALTALMDEASASVQLAGRAVASLQDELRRANAAAAAAAVRFDATREHIRAARREMEDPSGSRVLPGGRTAGNGGPGASLGEPH